VATLVTDDPSRPISTAVHFPAGPPTTTSSAAALGLNGEARRDGRGQVLVSLQSRALTYGTRVHMAGYEGDDDAFCLEPGHGRVLTLSPSDGEAVTGSVTVTALNLAAPLTLGVSDTRDEDRASGGT
jgi:hypothetical protein